MKRRRAVRIQQRRIKWRNIATLKLACDAATWLGCKLAGPPTPVQNSLIPCKHASGLCRQGTYILQIIYHTTVSAIPYAAMKTFVQMGRQNVNTAVERSCF